MGKFLIDPGILIWIVITILKWHIGLYRCPKRRRRTLRIEEVIPSTINIQPDPPSSSGHPSFKEKRKKNHKNDPVELLELSVVATTTLPEQVIVVSAEPEPENNINNDPQTVSVTSCLCVMFSFVIGGAVLFSIWEVYTSIFTSSKSRLIYFFFYLFKGMELRRRLIFLFHQLTNDWFWGLSTRPDHLQSVDRRWE